MLAETKAAPLKFYNLCFNIHSEITNIETLAREPVPKNLRLPCLYGSIVKENVAPWGAFFLDPTSFQVICVKKPNRKSKMFQFQVRISLARPNV